nr:uncharacterized protein LOC115263748 isoform X2 [Aedes albopictus]
MDVKKPAVRGNPLPQRLQIRGDGGIGDPNQLQQGVPSYQQKNLGGKRNQLDGPGGNRPDVGNQDGAGGNQQQQREEGGYGGPGGNRGTCRNMGGVKRFGNRNQLDGPGGNRQNNPDVGNLDGDGGNQQQQRGGDYGGPGGNRGSCRNMGGDTDQNFAEDDWLLEGMQWLNSVEENQSYESNIPRKQAHQSIDFIESSTRLESNTLETVATERDSSIVDLNSTASINVPLHPAQKGFQQNEVCFSSQIMIPGSKVGLIIGRRGQTIKDLQKKTGTKMVFIQNDPRQKKDKPLRISGDPQRVERAKQLVFDMLRKHNHTETHEHLGQMTVSQQEEVSILNEVIDNNNHSHSSDPTATRPCSAPEPPLASKPKSGVEAVLVNFPPPVQEDRQSPISTDESFVLAVSEMSTDVDDEQISTDDEIHLHQAIGPRFSLDSPVPCSTHRRKGVSFGAYSGQCRLQDDVIDPSPPFPPQQLASSLPSPGVPLSSSCLPSSSLPSSQTSVYPAPSNLPPSSHPPLESILHKEPKRTNETTWQTIKTNVPMKEAENFLRTFELGFLFKSENRPAKGTMRYYRCSRLKHRARPQCERKALIFIPNTTDGCTISCKGAHTCDKAPAENIAGRKLNPENHQTIEDLVSSGMPTKDVKKTIGTLAEGVTKNQLNYAIKAANKKLFGSGVLSLGELEEWAAIKSRIPQDNRTAFVLDKDIDHANAKFRFLVSSRQLLSLVGELRIIAADCTFKTTLEGFPLLVVCMVDEMRHAHPIAFGCLSNQSASDYEFAFNCIHETCAKIGIKLDALEFFISDGETALKSAAKKVFGGIKTINCYFHLKQNLKKYFQKFKIQADLQSSISDGIDKLQIAPTQKHYESAVQLFMTDYDSVPGFTDFFAKYVNNSNFAGWHEAFAPGVPSTNNAVEAINKSIKYNALHRQKQTLATFKTLLLRLVETYGDPARLVHRHRVFGIQEQREAWRFLNSGKTTRPVRCGIHVYMFIPGSEREEVSMNEIRRFMVPKYTSFEDYKVDLNTIHRVSMPDENYMQWNCTCRIFFKNNICSHIVIAAVKQGLYQLPPEADPTIIGRKKPTGRPKKMSKALVIE